MKILYLCHRIPYPPDKGEKIRAFHELQAIAARHEVDLFTLADDPADLVHQAALQRYCRNITVARLHPRWARLRGLPYILTRKPLSIPYFYSRKLRREIAKAVAIRGYDRIFVYCSAMAQYVEPAWGIPVITDFVDADSDKWSQYAAFSSGPLAAVYRREGRLLREYERQICRLSASVVVTTGREARLVEELSAGTAVHVISNGVDADYFRPPAAGSPPAPPTIGFTGDMSYFPNVEAVTYFAREVFPLVRRSVPGARFLIVGRNPSPKVRMLAKIDEVEVTGFVPDVREHLRRMQVAVAPFSIAAGIQNKILEAMASGIPVVCTGRAAQGLSSDAAGAVEVADEPAAMAERIVALLRNPELARARGAEGRRRVAAGYRWDQSLEQLLQLLETAAADSRIPEASAIPD